LRVKAALNIRAIRCNSEEGVLGSGPEMIFTPHERRGEAA
jgi:hypothetical protein